MTDTRYFWRRRGAPTDIMGPATIAQIHSGLRSGATPADVEIVVANGQSLGQLKLATGWISLPDSPDSTADGRRRPLPSQVTLTTAPSLEGFTVVRTLEVITAECVFGMNLFRDFFAGMTDIFGGRSTSTQNVLRDARVRCLDELREEAARLGANAVIAVDLAYSEFSGQGKSMLFLVASGTAVVVQPVGLVAPGPEQATSGGAAT